MSKMYITFCIEMDTTPGLRSGWKIKYHNSEWRDGVVEKCIVFPHLEQYRQFVALLEEAGYTRGYDHAQSLSK